MGKAGQTRQHGGRLQGVVHPHQHSAREKIAAQQASVERSDRRKKGLIAGGSIAVVLVLVVVLITVKLAGGSASKGSGPATGDANTAASVTRAIASVPGATLDKIAAGPVYPAKGSVYPGAIKTVKPAVATLASSDGSRSA